MEIKFEGLDKQRTEALHHLMRLIHIKGNDSYTMVFQKGNGIHVEKRGNQLIAEYSNDTQLYRTLLIASQLINKSEDLTIEEKDQFETKGVMLDLSRAGAMKVEKIKEYIEYMSLFGLNSLLLYMEDVFEVKGRPYFGYMRGRYSVNELKEIDLYGLKFGVEVIPCIQTLGHFEQYIKWKEAEDITDTSTVLMAEKDETYAFIDQIIGIISGCFTTKKIHIGLDEAWDLGAGNYLRQKGYKDGIRIFCDHIKAVKEITDKYGLSAMIWSDMYFRLGSKNGEYYDKDVEVPDYVKELLPENVKVTYWDYYHHDEETYHYMIKKHRKITNNLVFAGGIWTWTGFLPDYDHTFKAAKAALKVCSEEGIKDVFATVWEDDGCETNQMSSLIGCALYGEYSYNKEPDMQSLQEKIEILFQASISDFTDMSKILYPLSAQDRALSVKQIIYSDVICGLVDKDIEDKALVTHFSELSDKYRNLAQKEGYYQEFFAYTAAVAKVAADKVEISQKLHQAYPMDKELLTEVKDKLLPQLMEDLEQLKLLSYHLWHTTYKPFGFEIADSRFGGKMSRIETARLRLQDFLSGKIKHLEELEEERLAFNGKHKIAHFYTGMASAYMTKGF